MNITFKCPKYRKKISEQAKARWKNPKYRKKVSKAIKLAQNRPEVRKRNSERAKIIFNQPEMKKKNSERMNKLWADPEHIRKFLKATNKRPTYPESIFDEMTPEIVRYVGNRAWWRKLEDGKNHNPDFKVTGQNKVIEIFGDYWHKGEDPQELIDLYALAGLDCLVFWESEIYENPEQVIEKVDDFIGETHRIDTPLLKIHENGLFVQRKAKP